MMRSILIGFTAGLSIALPLFGGVGGVPSSGIAALVAAMAVLLLLPSIIATRQYRAILSLPLLAGAAFAFFVLLSAYESQWEFLASPDIWRQNASRYFDAKLFMFLLSFGTGAAASMLVLVADDKADTIKGVCLGVMVVSLMALLRLAISHGHQLWATDYEAARAFFFQDRGFSTVNYGILLMMGAICALRYRWGWVVSAILLAWVVLLARRADTIIVVFATISFFGFLWVKGGGISPLNRIVGFLIISTLVVFFGINGFSYSYFGNIVSGAQHRVDLLVESAEEVVENTNREYVANSEKLIDRELRSPLTGGLGYLSTGVLGAFRYPHNIIVEIYHEVGAAGLVAFIAVWLLPLLIALRHIRSLDTGAIVILLGMGSIFGISLKAGDISNAGKILFFATLAYRSVNCVRRPNQQ